MAQSFLRNGIAAGLACVGIGLALHGGDAQALGLVVEVGGSNYEVSTVSGTYNSLLTTLSAQPWFGNPTLAQTFATEVSSGLGLPNGDVQGPLFATGLDYIDPNFYVFGAYYYDSFGMTGVAWNSFGGPDDTFAFAQAQLQPPAPSAVPGPLPLLGAMAGYGMSRRLRTRIQAASPKRMGC
jgi:hypothetical protein